MTKQRVSPGEMSRVKTPSQIVERKMLRMPIAGLKGALRRVATVTLLALWHFVGYPGMKKDIQHHIDMQGWMSFLKCRVG